MIDKSPIDAILSEACAHGEIAGVVAVAASAGSVLYEGAAGRRSLAEPAPMDQATMFWIASMTKAVTTVAAMQQVEAGRLSLDAPLGDLLPRVAAARLLTGFDADGRPQTRPAGRPITLRQMLTHTAGYSNATWSAPLTRYSEATGLPAGRTGKRAALDAPLLFEPGERWEYSLGIDWAGQAVEAVTGRDLDRVLREDVFTPLGMTDACFLTTPEQRARQASVHDRLPDGTLQPRPIAVPERPEFFAGGGGLHMTGRDYIRFLRLLLNGGELDGARLLQPETVALMGRNHIGALEVPPMRSVNPGFSRDIELFPGMVKKWGLGFLINTEDSPGRRRAGSLAWAGIANTWYWLDPASDVAAVLMTQTLPFGDPKVMTLLDAFEAAVYAGL